MSLSIKVTLKSIKKDSFCGVRNVEGTEKKMANGHEVR